VLTFEGERAFVAAAAISPDNRHFVAVGTAVRLWSLAAPAAEPVELTGGRVAGFLPDGRVVVAGNTILLADPAAPHKSPVRFPTPEPVGAVLSDGLLVSPGRDAVGLWAVQGNALHPAARLAHPPHPSAVEFAPDRQRAAVGVALPSTDGKAQSVVRLCDLTGNPVGELEPTTGGLVSLAWSPCGRYIAGVLGARLVVWSAEDGKLRAELAAGGTRLFRCPRFHPGGRFLAAGGANLDGGVYCWAVGTWEELVGYRWPVGPVACVNFSPDGALAVAGGERGRILVWDVDA
jgi:WD40 repeat protein